MGKYAGKSVAFDHEKLLVLYLERHLVPEMIQRGLSLAKLEDFVRRLVEDGSPYLYTSDNHAIFELDARAYFDSLKADGDYLVEPDTPPPAKEPRFEMPPPSVLARMTPEQKLRAAERERLQKLADKAAGREPSNG